MIIKMSDVETHITPKSVDIGDIGCRFYTEDENTAFIRIRINYHGEPVDLTKTDMKPRLDLFMQDDSKFIDEKLEVLIPESGLVQYSIPPNVIKHAGRTKCKLFMMDNKKSIHVANFFFNIVDSGVEEAVSKEITLNLVKDTVREIISEDLTRVLDDDFKDKLINDVEIYLSNNNELFRGFKGEDGTSVKVESTETDKNGDIIVHFTDDTSTTIPKGKDGKSFTYDDFTPEQLASLKGPKGDPLKYSDLTQSERDELIKNVTNQSLSDFKIEDNSISNEKLVDGTITPEKTAFFTKTKTSNLFDLDTLEKGKTVDTNGDVINDDIRWLTGYIPLDSALGEQINFTQGTYRIGLYNSNKKFIIRAGVTNSTYYKPVSSTGTKYVRISGTIDPSTVMVNKGPNLLPFEKPYGTQIKLKQEFLPLQSDDNNSSGTLLPSDLAKIEQNIQTYTPSIPKLEFEEVTTGYYEALWLSKDGKRIYGKQGARLWVSYDECATFTTIINDTGISVQAVRELDDGELIFSTERDVTNHTQNGRVFKTKGFDKETGKIDTYELKVETPSTESKINNSWGITSYKNVVTLSEYGLRTEEGARRAWLSTDYGETFKLIFDQKETTKDIEGAPTWTETAHMHTCSFDPYWNRIWIVTGDRPNSATYYSDDFGETWKWVDVQFNNDTMQFTGIIALPNCVIFGSDRAPNGVFVYYRGNKSDTPVIQPLLLVNDKDIISHIFQIPFKRDWDSLTPVYFGAPNAGDTDNKSICVATVDGKKAFIIHENNSNEKFGGKCSAFLGDTAQGNIIGTFFDSDISGYRIGKAKAPTWTKL